MSLAWIVRNTAGALVSFVTLTLILPGLFGDVLGHWGKQVAQFLPIDAGAAFSTNAPEAPHLSPWAGLAVMALWALIGVAVGYVLLRRRDV